MGKGQAAESDALLEAVKKYLLAGKYAFQSVGPIEVTWSPLHDRMVINIQELSGGMKGETWES